MLQKNTQAIIIHACVIDDEDANGSHPLMIFGKLFHLFVDLFIT